MQHLLDFVITTFIFFLPAGIANMMPVLVARVPFLNVPMDFGHSFRGRRIFGEHKTWRGFVFGIGGSVAAIFILSAIFLSEYKYPSASFYKFGILLQYGIALGAGALLGDAVKSFFKRQLNIAPGKSWTPFDQVDWILGALIAVHLFLRPQPAEVWITALLLFGLLHPVVNILGYVLRIKKKMF